jgi:hypothetical protein
MFGEVAKTIKANLYDRATSPLLGAFVISWSFWNYRFFTVLFSSISPQEKFKLFDSFVFVSTRTIILQGIIYPVLTTAFFLFIYPHPARFVFQYWRKQQSKLKQIRQAIEDETPLTIEEAREIKKEALNIELRYENEIELKSKEIKQLKNELESTKKILEEKHNIINSEFDTPDSSLLDKETLEILKLISDNAGKVSESKIIKESKTSRVKTEYNLGELLNNKFINKDYDQSARDYLYSFTHKGRTVLVNMGHA